MNNQLEFVGATDQMIDELGVIEGRRLMPEDKVTYYNYICLPPEDKVTYYNYIRLPPKDGVLDEIISWRLDRHRCQPVIVIEETPRRRKMRVSERQLLKEHMLALANLYMESPEPVPDYRWKMANGELIRPCDMGEQHLRNTISFCQRRLVATCGTATYLDETQRLVDGLYHTMHEARRRGFRV